jgi:hypothetical protein
VARPHRHPIRHTDGTFDCSATSPDNHLIYQVTDDDESILEFTLAPPYGEIILFVKQLADGRSTELYRAHINSTPEFPPQLLSTLPGRNTGPHYVGPEGQIVWTRTLYEPETEAGRPRSSEIWRMNADGKNPVRLIAYPSTPTRAVLVTTGMGN